MSPDSILDSRYSWTRLAVSLVIAVTGNAGMWVIVVIMPAMQAEFGLDRGSAAMPYAATMLGFALGNLLFGRVVDRLGITPALMGAGVMIAAGYALAALAPAAGMLIALQFLIGLGTAASFGPLIADISLWFLRRRGIAVAIAASGNYLSGAIWPMVLAGVMEASGWRAVYMAMAAIAAVVMLSLPLLLRRRVPLQATAAADTQSASRAKSTGLSPRALQYLLGLAGIGCCVAMSMPQAHIVSLADDLGHGAAAGARMLSVMLMGGVVSRLVSGMLADRLGGVRTLLLGSALQCLALFLYLPVTSAPALMTVSLLFGLSQGGIVPSYALVVREYMPAAEAGRRVGFVIMMTVFGMALGGWLSGLIYDLSGSYRMAFVNGIAFNAVNIAIITMIMLRGRRGGAPLPA